MLHKNGAEPAAGAAITLRKARLAAANNRKSRRF
jgi:hypothetical protein